MRRACLGLALLASSDLYAQYHGQCRRLPKRRRTACYCTTNYRAAVSQVVEMVYDATTSGRATLAARPQRGPKAEQQDRAKFVHWSPRSSQRKYDPSTNPAFTSSINWSLPDLLDRLQQSDPAAELGSCDELFSTAQDTFLFEDEDLDFATTVAPSEVSTPPMSMFGDDDFRDPPAMARTIVKPSRWARHHLCQLFSGCITGVPAALAKAKGVDNAEHPPSPSSGAQAF